MPIRNVAEFYEQNVNLVHKISHKCYARAAALGSCMEYDDVFQEASAVFVQTCEKFDEERGTKFSTYFFKSAFNELNSIFRDFETERCELGTVSLQEFEENSGDTLDIKAEDITPEEAMVAAEGAEFIRDGLSPLSLLVCEWLINPPPFLVEEFEKVRIHLELARSRGFDKRGAKHLSVPFICEMLMLLGLASEKDIRETKAELKWAIEKGEEYGIY